MKSGIRWQVRGVKRQARETAREAARRSGMSVGQWLDTVIRDTAAEIRAHESSPRPPELAGTALSAPRETLDDFEPRYFEHDEDLDPMRRLPEPEAHHPDDDMTERRAPYQGGYADGEVHQQPADRSDRLQPGGRRPLSSDAFGGGKSPLDSLTQRLAEREALTQVRHRPDDLSRKTADSGLASVNSRLDSLSRQLESIAQRNPGAVHAQPPASRPDETARELAEVVAKIGRRLDQMAAEGCSPKNETDQNAAAVGDFAGERPAPNPPASPVATPLEQALKEIADRQRTLDDDSSVAATLESPAEPAPLPSTALPRAYTQEFSGLEQQLRQINEQIGVLNRPCGIDRAVEVLRDDLAEIGAMLQDAMPRTAVEALESEMRKLSDRIEETRQTGTDGTALAGIEHGLIEVRDALRALKPAENLAGLDDELKVISQKIDQVAGQSQDPASLKQLEGAIVAMRGIVTHVASNDALADLAAEMRALSAKVDQVTAANGGSEMFASLERRIGTLADALEARNRKSLEPSESDTVVAGLIDKMERLQSTSVDQTALRHLEDRIATLVEKLDASDTRLNQLEAVERGLAELLIHLEHQRVPNLVRASAETPPEVDALVRDVTGLKQMERQTQDALEAVHGTLGHVVDRLAMIETDLRDTAALAPDLAPLPRAAAATSLQSPSVAALKPAMPDQQMAPAPPAGELKMSTLTPSARLASAASQAPAATPTPEVSQAAESVAEPSQPKAAAPGVAVRQPIDPNLPPDHPLEPGVSRGRQPASPADRIAASEAVLGAVKPPVVPDPVGKSNFIAAARRAAQAAASEPPLRSGARRAEGPTRTPNPGKLTDLLRKHARAVIIGISVLAIVLGSLNIVLNWLASEEPAKSATSNNTTDKTATSGSHRGEAAPKSPVAAPASAPDTATEQPVKPAAPPSGRQSSLAAPESLPASGMLSVASIGIAPRPEVTGAVSPQVEPTPEPAPAVTPVRTPAPAAPPRATPAASANGAEKLPPGIGGALRAAAGKGDPTAQYEIAQRYADGRGVPQDLAESAAWLERAAKQGLAPAQFRLGGLYEKGLGVKKNLDNARHLYAVAGEAGNAKALHNLAVLYAEGIDGKPDYKSAAEWFRKAAAYGMADSQYNLGVLYARGIGVEQNLAEAYRWFALAAREGDQESEKKRADLASRLDPKSLQSAQQVIDGFTPEPQPNAATHVNAPAGGWDGNAGKANFVPSQAKR